MKRIPYAGAVMAITAAVFGCSDNVEPAPGPSTAPGDGAGASERVVARSDIVSDETPAAATDKSLVNAWGLAFNPAGPAWVSSTETGVSGVYDATGKQVIPSVTIPAPTGATGPSSPTGQVFNGDATAFNGDQFIFVTEQGTIAGWQPSSGSTATQEVDNSGAKANYKGVTIAKGRDGQPRLFASNFRAGTVEVFDRTYAPISNSGQFTDARIPSGFAPFNVQELDGSIIVTYAKQDEEKDDDVAGPGNGFVDLFDAEGALMARLVSGGELNSPWGVAKSPATFSGTENRLLIGNFGDGLIHVYRFEPIAGSAIASFDGPLRDSAGRVLQIDGLWALRFGLDVGGFRSDNLYFTAGPNEERHGVFGRLEPAQLSPTPSGGAQPEPMPSQPVPIYP
jgi:uncharacterized protein (TIGR03118 family)